MPRIAQKPRFNLHPYDTYDKMIGADGPEEMRIYFDNDDVPAWASVWAERAISILNEHWFEETMWMCENEDCVNAYHEWHMDKPGFTPAPKRCSKCHEPLTGRMI